MDQVRFCNTPAPSVICQESIRKFLITLPFGGCFQFFGGSYLLLDRSYRLLNGSYPFLDRSYRLLNGSYLLLNRSYRLPNDSYPFLDRSYRLLNDSYLLPDRSYRSIDNFRPFPDGSSAWKAAQRLAFTLAGESRQAPQYSRREGFGALAKRIESPYHSTKTGKASMLTQKSPSGAMFPYYYKNGELFGMHLGSYFSDEEGLIAMMKAEAAFSAQQHRRLGLWIDFYETKLTDRVIAEFVEMLKQMRPRVTKLAVVGAPWLARWKINRLIRKTELLVSLPVKYYEDPEEAKTWLVSEVE